MARTLAGLALAVGLAFAWSAAPAARTARRLPPIVFVSRAAPSGAETGQVPGLGPHGTFAGSGGRLLERAPDGTLRPLVPADRLYDVADPAVSEDGARVAFAARERAESPWRVWTVDRAPAGALAGAPAEGRSGSGDGSLRCRTCDDAAGDDADPVWWGDTLLFVSTRARGAADSALYDGAPVTQLWARAPDGRLSQLTHEPNGALDPAVDATQRRVLFARWWFNPWRADDAGGVRRGTTAADSVNLWQVVSARLARGVDDQLRLDDVRLAAGGTVPRRSGMGVQPAPLPKAGLVAVAARNTGLAPRAGTLALVRYAAPPSPGRRIAGAAIGDDAADPYTEGANLRAPAACAPAVLPDGRVLCALDAGGRGDFAVWLIGADGEPRTRLIDLPGTWELDPAPVPEPQPERSRPRASRHKEAVQIVSQPGVLATFRYLDLDVFSGRGAAARREDAQLSFYRLVGRDSVRLLGSVPVPRSGKVDLRLPADTPLFEVLTDAAGRVLASAHGPTQVRGFNSGGAGSTSRCTGCHLGHTAPP